MKKILILSAAVLFCVFSLYLLIGSEDHAGHSMTNDVHRDHGEAITTERSFLEHMIPHHQEAVDTARLLVEQGTTLRPLQELAEEIIAAQTTEIEQMKEWYRTWYQEEYEDTGVYAPMMRSFDEHSVAEIERMFLEDMIVHHEGAIVAAEKMLTLSGSAETKELANTIIVTQEAEITRMRELLTLLPK